MASNTPTGVDIGSASIRAVETNRVKDHSVVSNFGQAPLPAGVVQGGVINDERVVIGALKHLWSAHKFRNRDVVLGVTSHQIVVREITPAQPAGARVPPGAAVPGSRPAADVGRQGAARLLPAREGPQGRRRSAAC